MVEKNPNSIIISAHHYVLKNTTVASGEWEGLERDQSGAWKPRYHNYCVALRCRIKLKCNGTI